MKTLNHKQKNGNQQGITLLLAIIILSSVMAISFSLSTILFIEVRTSGDLLKTEGALYAANGVGEEAFFNIKRQTCPADGQGCLYSTGFANNVKLSGTPVTTSTSTPIFQDKVAANSVFGSTGQKIYDFCNVSTPASSGCGYGKVDITYLDTNSNGSIKVFLCEFDPKTNFGEEGGVCKKLNTSLEYWRNSAGETLNNSHSTVEFKFLDSSKQQILYITNYNTNADAYFQIKTYKDIDGIIPWGLPYVGKTAVDVNAVNTSVGRKIRVIVPNEP